MSLELSLFQIQTGLQDLYAMRAEAVEAVQKQKPDADAELKAVDEAIQLYLGAEVKKVDGTAEFILAMDRLCHEPRVRKNVTERCAIDLEIDRLKARRESLRGILHHVESAVMFVMEGMTWRPGKPRKLEGIRHSMSLRGNGGNQPVEIMDPILVPDEYKRITITMPLNLWMEKGCAVFGGCDVKTSSCEVSVSAVGEALNQPCPRCNGNGVVEVWGDPHEDAEWRPAENPCNGCGGSGKRGVPGARLADRGTSLVIK